MSQIDLQKASRDIITQAEETVVPQQGLSRVVDDYFIQRLKQDEMQHAEVDPCLYEEMRSVVKAEVLPLYAQHLQETARLRERRQKRKLWQYVLGTVAICEVLGALLTRGRSFAPQVLVPTAILESFLGFIIYAAAQYFDDLQLRHARRRLEMAIAGLQTKVQTDVDYDQRRQLLDADILRAEALEILTHYDRPEDFWRDYLKVRKADPTLPGEAKALNLPAFDKFLKFHVTGQHSATARQHRFNRLFVEAHEAFISRDREHYAASHLKNRQL